MPNISFDIFFDQDFINVTATRGKTAPKAKPEWKVRSAPKLPPKEKPVDRSGAVRPPQRPKINEGRTPVGKPTPKLDTSDAASQTGDAPRRKPPKLGPSKKNSAASVSDALAPTVSNAVSSAGGFAGGAVTAVGNTVSGVGESVNRTIRTYGDGVKDYGNSIMDWTSASATRAGTAANPLGLSGTKGAGSRAVTSPSLYRAPAPSKKPATSSTQKVAPAKKAASTSKPVNGAKATSAKSTPAKSAAPAKKAPVKPAGTANPGAMRGAGAQKKPVSAASKPQPKTAAKPVAKSTANKPDAHKPAAYMSSKSASNPIGITW